MLDIDKLESARKTVKAITNSLTRAYTTMSIDFLMVYFQLFVDWCAEQEHCTYEGSKLSWDANHKLTTAINWKTRDSKTNKLPKGTELKWFQFMFPDIPTERDDYRENALYRTLYRTVHPACEKLVGIEYHRVPKLPKVQGTPQAPVLTDDKGVLLPTSMTETDVIMKSTIVQALFATVADFVAKDPKHNAPLLLDHARVLQVSSGHLALLEQKQQEYVQRKLDAIAAAKKEHVA